MCRRSKVEGDPNRLRLHSEEEYNKTLYEWRSLYLQNKITKDMHAHNLVQLDKNQRFITELNQLRTSLHLILQTCVRNMLTVAKPNVPVTKDIAAQFSVIFQQGHDFVQYYNEEQTKLCKIFNYTRYNYLGFSATGEIIEH